MVVYIGFVIGFIFLIVVCFCMGDVVDMVLSIIGVLVIEIFCYFIGFEVGVIGLVLLIVVIGFGVLNGLIVIGGWFVYVFVCDCGLLFLSFLSRVNKSNSMLVNVFCVVVVV